MKLIIDISKDRYDEIMEMDWRNCRRFFDEEIRAIHDGMPQRTGHWIFVDKAHEHAHCSECDYGNVDLLDGRPHNYCSSCGAKMIEPQESEVKG